MLGKISKLLPHLQQFEQLNNILRSEIDLIKFWQQKNKNNPTSPVYLDNFREILFNDIKNMKKILESQFLFIYEESMVKDWQNSRDLIKIAEVGNTIITKENIEKIRLDKGKFERKLKNLEQALKFIEHLEQKPYLKQNISHFKSYIHQIRDRINAIDQNIARFTQDEKIEADKKSLGIGENISLPKRCVIVYIFQHKRKNKIFSVPSGGHLAIEVIHDDQSLYFSAAPGEALAHNPSYGENHLNSTLVKLHAPKSVPKLGEFNSKELDLSFLNASGSPSYSRCQAIVFDCSTPEARMAFDTEKMLDMGRKLKATPFKYNFWKNNCGDMAMELLRAGGLTDIANKYQIAIPKTLGITVPVESFDFLYQVASIAESNAKYTKPNNIQQMWRNNFGLCRSNLLLAFDIKNFSKFKTEILPSQKYLKELYEFFLNLESQVGSAEYSQIDKLEKFLQDAQVQCSEKLQALKVRLTEKDPDSKEINCYEQALSVLDIANNKFSSSINQFLRLEMDQLIENITRKFIVPEFKTMIGNHTYDNHLNSMYKVAVKERSIEDQLNEYDKFLSTCPELNDIEILFKSLGWGGGNFFEKKNSQEAQADKYLIKEAEKKEVNPAFLKLYSLCLEMNKVLTEVNDLSCSEITDSRAILFKQTEQIKNMLLTIDELKNENDKSFSPDFLIGITKNLQQMLGNINQKIYFELEPDQSVQKRTNILSHTKAFILPNENLQSEYMAQVKTYPDLRALFLDCLKKGKYAKFEKIPYDEKGQLLISRVNGKIIIPSVFKVWKKQERMELIELQALESLVSMLEKKQHINMNDFEGIRHKYLQAYKEKIYHVQMLDYFCAGQMSDNKLFGCLGISQNFQKTIELLKKNFEAKAEIAIKKEEAVQTKSEPKFSPVRFIKNKLAFIFFKSDNTVAKTSNNSSNVEQTFLRVK